MSLRGTGEQLLDAAQAASRSGVRAQLTATERLVEVSQDLSHARDLETIMLIVRHAARELTGAEGATFVLRDGDRCFYADEDAISPLWKGHRFPMSACISGWTMLHREAAVIEDIYADERIPHDAYRPTFVKSLAMVPIRTRAPVGAIGNYWAERHRATDGEVKLLRALADLTSVAMENVQLYGELEKRIGEAQEALHAREEFIAVAAHELRTPLTAMLLQLQRLEEMLSMDGSMPKVRDCAARSTSAGRRIAALVDALIDASDHERVALNLERFDLVETAREVLGRFSGAAQRAQCALELNAIDAAYGDWDRLRLEQVLSTLISNALKYGSGKPVEVAVSRYGHVVHVEVRDRGPGVADEIASKIFARFGRAGPISHGGLGLGLYLARRAVEAHGGTIGFKNEPNVGCTFIIDLPMQPPGHGLPGG